MMFDFVWFWVYLRNKKNQMKINVQEEKKKSIGLKIIVII